MTFKELMSEVLGVEVLYYKVLDNTLSYQAKDKYQTQAINIYELAHKCKEWAFNKGGIDITSGKRLGLDGWECLVFIGVIPCDCYEADTEPEAIFKACEWIMEQTKCGS